MGKKAALTKRRTSNNTRRVRLRTASLKDRTPTIAKLSAPSLGTVVARTQLFKILDQGRRQASILWVSAPAGAGKTMLAASYLKSRKLRHLWYRLDTGDGDPASCFYYLGLAVQKHAPRRLPLPMLTPEYLLGLPVFGRNFFRELGARLKPPAILVFDNYQDISADSPLHELLVAGIAELPKGIIVLVLSRSEPPPAFARLRVAQKLAPIDASALQLTIQETGAIARLHQQRAMPREMAERLHALTHGWAAGLVLLLQQNATNIRAVEPPVQGGLPGVLFDYFASEVMRRAEPAVQDFLRYSALLPQMSVESAAALTNNPLADKILTDLERRNYFIVSRPGKTRTYEYHPLFRDFLLSELVRALPPAGLHVFQRRAAGLLIGEGHVEAAVALLHAAGDFIALAALVVAQAPALITQGRHRILEQWLNMVPPDIRVNEPWLEYWSGVARLPFNPLAAREHFECVYSVFRSVGDAAGLYLTWAGIAETFIYQWDDFTEMERWLAEHHELRAAHTDFPSPEIEARVVSAMFGVLMYMQPQHPEMEQSRQRIESLIPVVPDPDFRIWMIGNLALYYNWTGSPADEERVLMLGKSIMAREHVSPLSQIMAAFFQSTCAWLAGQVDISEKLAAEALQVAEQSGVHMMDTHIIAQFIYAFGLRRDLPRMSEYLDRIQKILSPQRRIDLAHYHLQSGWLASLQGNQAQAVMHIRPMLDLVERMSAQVPIALGRIGLAQLLAQTGELEEALMQLDRAMDFARAMSSRHLQFMVGTVRAYIRLRQGDAEACASALRPAFEIAARSNYWSYPMWDARFMSPVCAFALRHGIETDYVRALIQKWDIKPDATLADLEAWPFSLKIHTLGRFALLRDGKPLRFEGKTQKKPLELLKLLIALGGREVAESRVLDALWPDAEADQARQNFKVALHRLRKLIGNEVLVLNEGKLTLDARQAWVDVWACERLLNESRDQLHTGHTQSAIDSGQRAVKLYQGAFLHADDQPFLLPLRERLRTRLLGHLGELARSLCETRACPESLALYRKGIEIDPLTESFYQGLMHCHQCLKQPAEALKTYERCRKLLKSQLGVDPSPQTLALEQEIRRSLS